MKKNLSFKKCLKESMADLPIDMGDMFSEFERDIHKALDRVMDNYAVYNASNDDLRLAVDHFIKKNTVTESCNSKIECIHSEYDDDFSENNNYYDVETAHEFVGLDDAAPKVRRYDGEEIEIEYDDEF